VSILICENALLIFKPKSSDLFEDIQVN